MYSNKIRKKKAICIWWNPFDLVNQSSLWFEIGLLLEVCNKLNKMYASFFAN